MFLPNTDATAFRARLGAVGWVDINHLDTRRLGLVLHKLLQLMPGPAMQARAHTLTGLAPLADVGQFFHRDKRSAGTGRFAYHRLARFVINMAHVPSFFARDLFQQLSCRLTAVGLKTPPQRQVPITNVFERTASQDFPAGGRSEIVFSKINAENTATRGSRRLLIEIVRFI